MRLILLASIAAITTPALAGPVSFRELIAIDGGFACTPAAISSDGSVIVGSSSPGSGDEATRWVGGLTQRLGSLQVPGVVVSSSATGVSLDGSVVVGNSYITASDRVAFRHTASGMVQVAGTLSAPSQYRVSDDGSKMAGAFMVSGVWAPTRWNAGTLERLLPPPRQGRSLDLSADGSVVTGYAISTGDINRAFAWTEGSGGVNLPLLAGAMTESEGQAVSPDGDTIVGYNKVGINTIQAVVWHRLTASTWEIESLGTIAGAVSSRATDVSADGSVIVGTYSTGTENQTFVRTPSHGMETFVEFAGRHGIDLTGWRVLPPVVSADGNTFAARAIRPDGQSRGIVLTVPAPASLCAMSVLLAARRRRAIA